ncbi:hypothetical protein BJV74DRAFT_888595 [Russula compacta]|nr:hypothetical protein BJV74DRAFT_888595 [Russula compacta]
MIIPAYVNGTHKAITKELIARAFEKTGLYPVNHHVFTPEDFALSKASSTTAHVPDSFPHMPSSDPIDPSDDDFIISDDDSVSDHESLSSDEDPSSDDEESSSNLILSNVCNTSNDHNNNCDLSNSETKDQDTRSHETVINDDQIKDRLPVSGLMVSITNLESSVIHMTHSATAKLNLYMAEPPRTVSHHEDSQQTYQELLNEL